MKNLSFLHTVSRFLAVTLLCIVSCCAVSCAPQSSCYSFEGMAFVAGMGYGWNLGTRSTRSPTAMSAAPGWLVVTCVRSWI